MPTAMFVGSTFKKVTNVAPMRDNLNVTRGLLSAVRAAAIHAMKARGRQHAASLPRACEMPHTFKAMS